MNALQSVDERSPRAAEDAVGILKVMVCPEPVMVKSEPAVEVAKSTEVTVYGIAACGDIYTICNSG